MLYLDEGEDDGLRWEKLCFERVLIWCLCNLFQVALGLHVHQDVSERHLSQCGGSCGCNIGIIGGCLPTTPFVHSSAGLAGPGQVLQL